MAPKKILVLGSGLVARPCVDYLVRRADNEVTVGALTAIVWQQRYQPF